MCFLIGWIAFGFLVGILAKFLHPGDDPVGFIPTVGIGIAGSFVGGAANWMLQIGDSPFEPSGFLMSILGGVVFCMIWRWWSLNNAPTGPKSFFTGKKLK